MEVENQNAFATSSEGRAKGKKGLREHMARDKQNSFEDLFNEGGGRARGVFTNSNHSEENLFDDFDDPFEDERDHATTVTPVDKPERTSREANCSPKGVDEQIGFDPFSALGNTGNSFYQKREFGDGHSDDNDNDDDVEKSPLQQKLQNVKSRQDSMNPFKATSTTRDRRSTMSQFAPVSSMALQKKNDDSGFALPAEYQSGKSIDNRRAAWNRRASTSNLNLSSHSSHSSQSDTTGMASPGAKTPRRAGKRPDMHNSQSTGDGDDQMLAHSSHGADRPRWGRFASMTNLSKATTEMPAGFAVPATPCATVQKLGAQKLFGNTTPNPFTVSPATPSRRLSIGVGMATPKKPVLKMIRRASVATGLGNDITTMTPKLTRRASVSTGLANDPSTPMASMRVRIRQQRKGSATGATNNAKIDEGMVRRLVKEHLAKEKQKKKEQVHKDEEERERDTADEDETEGSDSDDDSVHSFEDDGSTSCSSRSSGGSRWEDEGDRVDEVPRLLKRVESSDGDALLPGWSPEVAAAALEEGGLCSKEKASEAEESAEREEGQKVRKKTRKVKKVKKDKKDKIDKTEKTEKKVRKVKKEKKKIKAKAKSGNEDAADDDEGSVSLEAEETKKLHSSVAHAEVLSAIKHTLKKKVKKPKKPKKKDPEEQ